MLGEAGAPPGLPDSPDGPISANNRLRLPRWPWPPRSWPERVRPVMTGTTAASGPSTTVEVAAGPEGYEATIRRTTDGVPHITAADDASLAFGQG